MVSIKIHLRSFSICTWFLLLRCLAANRLSFMANMHIKLTISKRSHWPLSFKQMPAYVCPHLQILRCGDKLSNYKMDNSQPIASTTYANGASATAVARLHHRLNQTTACTTWTQLRLIKVVAINRNEISPAHPLPNRHPHTRRLLTAVGRN